MRRSMIVSTMFLAGIATGCGAALSSPTPAAPTPTSAAASPTGTGNDLLADVDIGGSTFHIVCVGPTDTGRPTVVFEAGLTGDLSTWSPVLMELQATDRACAYDRLGTGQSSSPSGPRTTATQVTELRALLAEVDVEPPFVLVGYSLGGWNVMVHHDAHPADVVAAVMVDVRPPGVSERWLALLPEEEPDEPEAVRLNREDLTVFETDPTLNPEQLDLRASAAEALATGGFGDTPLIVLAAADTSAGTEGLDEPLATAFDDAWWELQEAMADQSSRGRLVRVENATHDMPFERADAIVDAILEVLGG